MALKRYLMLFLVVAAIMVGCIGGTDPTRASDVAVSFATQSAAAPAPSPRLVANGVSAVSGAQLILTSVEMVLREIELKRADVSNCNVDPEPDGCEKFAVGPVLVNVPLTPGAQQLVAINIAPGAYSEIEFNIHKVSGDPVDSAFRQQHPAFADISIRVQGTYSGTPFGYATDLDVEQVLTLVPNLTVGGDGASTNVTVLVDVSQWFRDEFGNEINPEQANKGGPFESIVNENIKQSIEAFEDEDKDGAPS